MRSMEPQIAKLPQPREAFVTLLRSRFASARITASRRRHPPAARAAAGIHIAWDPREPPRLAPGAGLRRHCRCRAAIATRGRRSARAPCRRLRRC